MIDLQGMGLHPNQEAFLQRFVVACYADDRIVSAFLGGSNVKGYADDYSDVDLCVITTDQSFKEFFDDRESFLRSLGELLFLEDFDIRIQTSFQLEQLPLKADSLLMVSPVQ